MNKNKIVYQQVQVLKKKKVQKNKITTYWYQIKELIQRQKNKRKLQEKTKKRMETLNRFFKNVEFIYKHDIK